MAVPCVYVIFFNSQKIFFFSFRCTTHNKTKIFRKLKTLLECPQEWDLPKPLFFFIVSANLWGFCCLFWNICIFPCFWKWYMGFPDQQRSWPVRLRSISICCQKAQQRSLTNESISFCFTVVPSVLFIYSYKASYGTSGNDIILSY